MHKTFACGDVDMPARFWGNVFRVDAIQLNRVRASRNVGATGKLCHLQKQILLHPRTYLLTLVVHIGALSLGGLSRDACAAGGITNADSVDAHLLCCSGFGGFQREALMIFTIGNKYNIFIIVVQGVQAMQGLPDGVTGKAASWSVSQQELAVLLQQGMDDTADYLASRFAVANNGGNANVVSISVDGIHSLAEYARINEYLASLTSVMDVQVEQVTGSQVQYSLQLNGGLQDLTRTVSIGTVLEPVFGDVPGNYRLRQ